MAFGIEILDNGGSLTAPGTNTYRFIDVFNVSTVPQTVYNRSLANVDYDGQAYILFSPSDDNSGNQFLEDGGVPQLEVTGTNAKITTKGLAGTVYLGVT